MINHQFPWTFLFTDLEGSTRLWQEHPEAMKSTLARHDELIRTAVEQGHGRIVKTTGDGFHAAFADPVDAVRAAVRAQQLILGETWGETGPLHVRMGLHEGQAQERGGDYYGTAVNRAARLMAAAHGGQILVSQSMAAELSGRLPAEITLRDLGEHRLKDLQRGQRIYQVLHPSLPDSFPPIGSLNRLPNNLPSQPTLFVGRQKELREITTLLLDDNVRLLTLLGPGGTGKTRLALQVAAELSDHFPDGAYFVDLAPIRDPDAVPAAIARTIGIGDSSTGSLLDDLRQRLSDKRLLLLLDNFEQVTEAAVDVAGLMQFCPRLKLLVTSREALRVRGEHLYPVPPLGLPSANGHKPSPEELANSEAVQLFIERARAVRPVFDLDHENSAAVADIARRLDGLPLAIELAAARIRLFSPQDMQRRLQTSLDLLRGGARDLPQRQQTLRDTIAWSYDLLSQSEQKLFAAVSVFSGGTFDDIESVAGSIPALQETGLDVLDGLASLVDKSLLSLSDEGHAGPRLRMLETIREYAAARLREDPGLQQSACHAHAAYFATFAKEHWQDMSAHKSQQDSQEMASELVNLQIAWRYWAHAGDLERLQQMVDPLWVLYENQGWYQDTVQLTEDLLHVLAETPASPDQVRQEILLQTSLARALLAIHGYTAEVEEAYTKALALSEEHGEVPQLFPVMRALASYYLYRAEFDKAARMGQRILELAESGDDDALRIHGYLVLGVNEGFLKGYDHGLAVLNQGIDLFERLAQSFRPFQLGNNPGIVCYTTSGFLLYWSGLADSAEDFARKALTWAERLDHPFTHAYALFHTGVLYLWMGHAQVALDHAQRARQIATGHGFQIWELLALMLSGAAKSALGDPAAGLPLVEDGFARYQVLTTPPVFLPQLIQMRADAFARAGQPDTALRLLDDLLQTIPQERLLHEAPLVFLMRGDLLLALSPREPAKPLAIYRDIYDVSQQANAKLLALQSLTRLTSLEFQQGTTAASAPRLAELYDTFTQGHDTADLQQARAVLDQWQATA